MVSEQSGATSAGASILQSFTVVGSSGASTFVSLVRTEEFWVAFSAPVVESAVRTGAAGGFTAAVIVEFATTPLVSLT